MQGARPTRALSGAAQVRQRAHRAGCCWLMAIDYPRDPFHAQQPIDHPIVLSVVDVALLRLAIAALAALVGIKASCDHQIKDDGMQGLLHMILFQATTGDGPPSFQSELLSDALNRSRTDILISSPELFPNFYRRSTAAIMSHYC